MNTMVNVYLYCLNNPVNFYDPSGYILLNINSTGNDVVNIQAKLVILGYLDMTNTEYGYYGSSTYEAVKEFQKSRDLVQDGIVGNNTWNKLIKQGEFYLALGSKGAKVTKMQNELNRIGYELGAIDGDFGQQTLIAVNAFKDSTLAGGNQGKFRGLVGATTWYDYLFPLGSVVLTIENEEITSGEKIMITNVKKGQAIEIKVYSKNAHHVAFEITDPSGNKTWFGNTEGESYIKDFIPTKYGTYKIVGASRNTASSYDLATVRKDTSNKQHQFRSVGAVIFQAKRRQGLDKDGNIAKDMTLNDYTRDEFNTSVFGQELAKTEEQVFNELKDLGSFASSLDEDMKIVVLDLINHFKYGNGFDYSHTTLTNKVKEHTTTQTFVNLVKNTLIKEIKDNNGNLSKVELYDINDGLINQTDLQQEIQRHGDFPHFTKLSDKFNGLTISVHDTWGNTVDVRNYSVENNTFKGTLHFRIYDHFGLDPSDIYTQEKVYDYVSGMEVNELTLAGLFDGFRSWFVLQHYNKFGGKYKPFATFMEFEIPFEGELN